MRESHFLSTLTSSNSPSNFVKTSQRVLEMDEGYLELDYSNFYKIQVA